MTELTEEVTKELVKKTPKPVGITSDALAAEGMEGIQFMPLAGNADASEEDVRDTFRRLFVCEYVAVDIASPVSGMIVGYCLASQIPFVTVGVSEFYGSYAHCDTIDEWTEFVSALQEQEWILVAEA